MANVKVTVEGIPARPLGMSVQYAANSIPLCMVRLDPTDSKIIQENDSYKMQPVTVTADVDGQTLTFSGYFDGVSVNSSYGSTSYAAVIKGSQQLLLNTYVKLPGLSAAGLNPFKRTGFIEKDLNGQTERLTNLVLGKVKVSLQGKNLLQLFKELIVTSLESQTSDGYIAEFKPAAEGADITDLLSFFSNDAYKQKTIKALELVRAVDLAAVNNIDPKLGSAIKTDILNGMIKAFLDGPDNVWEAMLSYYTSVGCVLLPSKDKIFVLPDNGFIRPKNASYSKNKRGGTNEALPADYAAYSIDDNGYRDVGYVAIVQDVANGNDTLGNTEYYKGGYPAKGTQSASPGGAVVVLNNHPFIYLSGDVSRNSSTANTDVLKQYTSRSTNVPNGPQTFKGFKSDEDKVIEKYSEEYNNYIRSVVDNYAETKFYQLRYGDRTGGIQMDFNPQWVPATAGVLFSKAIEQKVFFNVQSVQHSISVDAPSSGSALTNVSFVCARSGTNPPSVDQDKLYNYGNGDMVSVQQKFLQNIK